MNDKKYNIIVNLESISDTLSCIYAILADEERIVTDKTIASSIQGLYDHLERVIDDVDNLTPDLVLQNS